METLKNTEKQKQESKSNAFLWNNNSVHGKLHQTNIPTKLDKVILYIGTNDLRLKKEPLEIASSIIDLAKTCRENGCDTII